MSEEVTERSTVDTRNRLFAVLSALRLHHVAKNVLIFLPVIAAQSFERPAWVAALWAFVCFSMIASAGYLMNDLQDRDADRAHPRKRLRAIAAGELDSAAAGWMIAGLVAAAAALGLLTLPFAFLVVLGLYLAGTMAYSLWLKRLIALDICVIAGLLTMRVFAGGTATGIEISHWLLAFSIFFFLSMAATKRLAELAAVVAGPTETVPGRAYRLRDIPPLLAVAAASGFMSVLVLTLYISSPEIRAAYIAPEWLWGICPIMTYWVGRVLLIAHRGDMPDDPVVFALTDRVSWISVAGVAICLAVASFA